MDELRRKGLEKMNEVYGWGNARHARGILRADRRPPLRDHLDASGIDHARQADHDADRCYGAGLSDLAEIQANAALANGELTEDELKEMAIFLTHYLGFPLDSKLDGVVTKVTRQRKKKQGDDKKVNVDAALNMHSGSSLRDE